MAPFWVGRHNTRNSEVATTTKRNDSKKLAVMPFV